MLHSGFFDSHTTSLKEFFESSRFASRLEGMMHAGAEGVKHSGLSGMLAAMMKQLSVKPLPTVQPERSSPEAVQTPGKSMEAGEKIAHKGATTKVPEQSSPEAV